VIEHRPGVALRDRRAHALLLASIGRQRAQHVGRRLRAEAAQRLHAAALRGFPQLHGRVDVELFRQRAYALRSQPGIRSSEAVPRGTARLNCCSSSQLPVRAISWILASRSAPTPASLPSSSPRAARSANAGPC